LFAFSGGRSAWIAVVVLVAAAFTHVLGELLQAAGSWGLSFALAPEHAQGQYQGAFDMGYALASIAAPIVVTTLTVGWGAPGWLLLGAMFAVAGALVPPVARWAERNRPHHLDTAEPLAA
jgi:MFS family permease